MKAIRTILAVIACFIIAIGIFSVIGYELYFRHAEPVLPEQQTMQEEPEKTEPEETEEPEEPEEPAEPEQSAEELRARELVTDLTLEQKVYQMFFVTPESLTGVDAATRAGDATKEALLENPVGGLLYSDKNIEDEDQLKELLSGSQTFLKEGEQIPAFLAIDEEGGDNAPVADALGTSSFDPMADIGAAGDESAAYAMGQSIGKDLSALGFNVNFAPVADLAGNDVIGSRAFSDNGETAAAMVGNVVKGTQESKVLNAVTHFPGLGSINDVAHIERTKLEKSLDDMKAADLLPFRAAIENEVGFIIVSHSIMTSVDDQRPCSMSAGVMTMLRDELGFRGIILSDSMDIPAITDRYDPDDAALNAVTAGADMVLCPSNLNEAVKAIVEAVEEGELEESRIDESVVRILTAKLKLGLIS